MGSSLLPSQYNNTPGHFISTTAYHMLHMTFTTKTNFSFTLMTNCAIVGLNTFVIFVQLFVWASKKHQTYKKRFVAYPANRSAFIPGLC